MAGEWLSTKKHGRDDDAIERDKAQAKHRQQELKRRRRPTTKRNQTTSRRPSQKQQQQQRKGKAPQLEGSSSEEEEYNDEMEDEEVSSVDNVVLHDDDDDEISEAASSSSEVVMPGRHRKPPPRNRLLEPPTVSATQSSSNNDSKKNNNNDSSSSDSDDGFLASAVFPRRTSAPARPLVQKKAQAAAAAAKSRPNPLDQFRHRPRNPYAATNKNDKASSIKNSNSGKPLNNKKLSNNKNNDDNKPSNNKKSSQRFASSAAASPRTEPRAASNNTNKNSKTASLNLSSSDDDDNEEEELTNTHPPLGRAKGTAASATRPPPSKRRRIVVDDEDVTTPSPSGARTSKSPPSSTDLQQQQKQDGDDELDENEQMALAVALSASLQEEKRAGNHHNLADDLDDTPAKPQNPKGKKSNKKLQHKPTVLELLDSESEAEKNPVEDDDDPEDEFVADDEDDAAKKTAENVLATANELSAKVLRTMHDWVAANTSASQIDTAASAPMGMIVDGALALFDMAAMESQGDGAHNSTWISNELMQQICPKVILAPYQLIGVNWMALLHGMQVQVEDGSKTNVNGVLADEMGLGKTVQTITFLAWLKHQRSTAENKSRSANKKKQLKQKKPTTILDDDEDDADGNQSDMDSDGDADTVSSAELPAYAPPHLVVAPASVLSNWEREFGKFAPHLNVVKFHGTKAERDVLKDKLMLHLPKNIGKRIKAGMDPLDAILVPVTSFEKERSDDRAFLRKFHYDYLVVDEAHLLKNARGQRYKSLDRFNTDHRLLLTGTPVQNTPRELMNLLCFLMPLFSKKARGFDDEDANDGGESMLQHFVSLEAAKSGTTDDSSAYLKLKQLFAPFVLRRRKQDVLRQIMPPKERKVEFVGLDSQSRQVYDSIISNHVMAKKAGSKNVRDHVFTQLRKAAHHPLLLRTRHTSKSEKEELASAFYRYGAFRGDGCTLARVKQDLERWNDFEIHLTALDLIGENERRRQDLQKYVLDEEDLFSSAKFVRLRTLLPQLISEGHRVLIFSVWTSCLDLLSCLLEQLGLECLRMEGSTPVAERQGLIDQFTNDTSIPIFLLSTKACGLGINLTSADTVVFHDIDFNPFNDLQAEDRVHRIGQKKTTTVIKMVSKDTVDEDIYEMQQRKARMNAAIMETSSSANKWEADAKKEVLNSALGRFRKLPEKPSEPTDSKQEQENSRNGSDREEF